MPDNVQFYPHTTCTMYCACCGALRLHKEVLYTMACRAHGLHYLHDYMCTACGATALNLDILPLDALGDSGVMIVEERRSIDLPFGSK